MPSWPSQQHASGVTGYDFRATNYGFPGFDRRAETATMRLYRSSEGVWLYERD
jgi:hypothetical protein